MRVRSIEAVIKRQVEIRLNFLTRFQRPGMLISRVIDKWHDWRLLLAQGHQCLVNLGDIVISHFEDVFDRGLASLVVHVGQRGFNLDD